MIRHDGAFIKPFSIFQYTHHPFSQHTWHVMMFLYESEYIYVTKYTTNLNGTLLRVLKPIKLQ